MKYPKFYDSIESIEVQDYLSSALGAFEGGKYTFNYIDSVKLAGHSCPTVAGAYIMAMVGLKALYKDEIAVRGNIKVSFSEGVEEGLTGVISNVISQITGATDKSGFKGLSGKFARHSLMNFNEDIESSVRFTRVDTAKQVDVIYNPSSILPNPKMNTLMQKISKGEANSEEVKEFGMLWQDRVQRIFENLEEVVRVEEL